MAQSDLRKIRSIARKQARVQQELLQAIIRARESGETYRDIARAAGTSHQRIWQLMRQQPPTGS